MPSTSMRLTRSGRDKAEGKDIWIKFTSAALTSELHLILLSNKKVILKAVVIIRPI